MTGMQQAQPPQHTSLPVTLVSNSNGLGLTSVIVGAVALIGAFIPIINFGSGLLAIVGLVFGVVGWARKGRPKGTAIVGVITSVIAMILSVVMVFVYTAGFVSAFDNSLPTVSTQGATEPEGDGRIAEAPAGAELGTRENPAAIGTVVETTSGGAVDYEVSLGVPTLNANDLVAAANQFNDPAPEGLQYAMVPVSFTYKGTETGTPWLDLNIEFVSAAGTTHTTSDVSAVPPAPSLTDANELYADASGTANIVIAVPSADIESGTWTVSALFSSEKIFFVAQ